MNVSLYAKHLMYLTYTLIISLSVASFALHGQEIPKEKLNAAIAELEKALIDGTSKKINGSRIYFKSEVPYTVDVNGNFELFFYIASDTDIKDLSWDIKLTVYRKEKTLLTQRMYESKEFKTPPFIAHNKNQRIFKSSLKIEEIGGYFVVFESSTVDKQGKRILHKATEEIRVQTPPAISLTGEIIDTLIDTNNNGLADKLRIVLPFNRVTNSDEKYLVHAEIGNEKIDGIGEIEETKTVVINNKPLIRTFSTKNIIAHGQGIVNSSDTAVEIEFKGKDIAKKHREGKLRVINISIKPLNFSILKGIKRIPFLGEIQSYSYKQFERQLITVNQEKADISLVDQDLDGVFEGLNIKFDVSVVFDSEYEARMLYGEQPYPLFEIKEYFELSEGQHEINIFVPAQRLVNAKANGRTVITAFHFRNIKSKDWTTAIRHNFGVTPPFTCEDFGDCTIRSPKPKKATQNNYH